ncbi:hypothetical protein J5N97_006072 [Dioscorea zingiberensis]|uniref:Uncharacterized protein n=1 Tax=Dioscorea zingiberensis TaxID=325984 RepID=A0A9D5D9N4_9LILI|nr:hypothetical protein J5N97_006072 [Dioscorea zingiberensis]
MALFFDLSIPYIEAGHAPASETKPLKDVRLRSVAKAMEIGYAGVAYDRCFRGVISERDRCKIPSFPLASLVDAAPALYSSVSLHRGLLGAPLSSPFHQYTRLTVLVDSAASASAIHSSNPLFRSYDIVAARPLNQVAFEHACQVSEVDLISVDFSGKVPFRLKLPMVEAAIKRGVYFEVTYASLISDVNRRRQMLAEAKLLVDWARGRNIIISSAASNVNELRGPYDVINLSAILLGLSKEKAKNAISKNCRSLLENTLRKKHFYKEAIRIERVPDRQDPKSVWFGDWNDWDPISSGQGDLRLFNDMSKFISAASDQPRSSSAIDFEPLVDGMEPKSKKSGVKGGKLSLTNELPNLSSLKTVSSSEAADEVPSAANDETNQQDGIGQFLFTRRAPMVTSDVNKAGSNDPLENQIVVNKCNVMIPDVATLKHSVSLEIIKPLGPCVENCENSDEPDTVLFSNENQNDAMVVMHDMISVAGDLQKCIALPIEDNLLKGKLQSKVIDQEQKDDINCRQQPHKLLENAMALTSPVLPEVDSKKTNPMTENNSLLKEVFDEMAEQNQNSFTTNATKHSSSKQNPGKGRQKFPIPLRTLSKPYPSRSRQANGQRRVRGRFARRDESVEGVVELKNHYQVMFSSELGDEGGYGFTDESHPLDTYNNDSTGHWVRQIQEDWCSFINFDAFPFELV